MLMRLMRGGEATDNATMVRELCAARVIKNPEVLRAMLAVDRGNYAPDRRIAYFDQPVGIGYRATISAPHMHAHSLELLAPFLFPGSHALDVGSGSGYLTACMAHMVGPSGKVIGIEYVGQLVELSLANMAHSDGDSIFLATGVVEFIEGDGWKGCPEHAPYDAIHVGAAAATVPPALLEQLRPGGRMVIPVGTDSQDFCKIDRLANGEFTEKRLMSVRYVPLVSPAPSADSVATSL